jgi:hypothetical protein
MNEISFANNAIVSCGTLSMELQYLREAGFLDTNHLMFTTPGLHEDPRELERQLIQRINQAKEKADKVLVVYGGKFCYVNAHEPTRTMKKIIEEQGPRVARIEATHCMDMLASGRRAEGLVDDAGLDQVSSPGVQGMGPRAGQREFPQAYGRGDCPGCDRICGSVHGGKARGISGILGLDGYSHSRVSGHLGSV